MGGNQIVAERVERIVEAATLAPSIHNTQPWRFTLDGDVLELRADRTRHLPATDPDGRQLLVSCGAALFGAWLAVRWLGRCGEVELLPSTREPDLLARLAVGDPHDPTPEDRRLYDALPRRRTHRGPFEERPIERGLLVALQRAAEGEGTVLHLLEHPGHRRSVAWLVAAAERAQQAHPGSRRELLRWTPDDGDHRRDGVPVTAYPRWHDVAESGALQIRDFDAGRQRGLADPTPTGTPPEAAVLLTAGDRPADHLRAGIALQRVLLTAASAGLQASMHSQPIGLDGLRSALRDSVPHEGTPQMLLQLGYAVAGPPTPRRPISEVLDVALQRAG